MASWEWEAPAIDNRPDGGIENWYLYVEHDGRVTVAVSGPTSSDSQITVDQDEFEAMCRSYLDRMTAWRARVTSAR